MFRFTPPFGPPPLRLLGPPPWQWLSWERLFAIAFLGTPSDPLCNGFPGNAPLRLRSWEPPIDPFAIAGLGNPPLRLLSWNLLRLLCWERPFASDCFLGNPALRLLSWNPPLRLLAWEPRCDCFLGRLFGLGLALGPRVARTFLD